MKNLNSVSTKSSSLLIFGTLCGLASLAGSAQAYMIGSNISYAKERLNPSVCEIKISDYDGQGNQGECSGTLVSSTQVYTAGHCFGRNFEIGRHTVSVSCGGRFQGQADSVKTPNSANDSLWFIDNRGIDTPVDTGDFAIINFHSPVSQITSPVATGPGAYFDVSGNLLPGVACKALGYGTTDINGPEVSDDGVPNIGSLVEADLKDDVVMFNQRTQLIMLLPRSGATLATSCGAGDSGGPLFCKAPGNLAYELMGTIVSRQHQATTADHAFVKNTVHPAWIPVQ
jgi:hypothetical protein